MHPYFSAVLTARCSRALLAGAAFCALTLTLAAAPAARAHEHGHHHGHDQGHDQGHAAAGKQAEAAEARPDHYAVQPPTTRAEAIEGINRTVAEISTLVDAETKAPLTAATMESIHEHTYYLEAAVKLLRTHSEAPPQANLLEMIEEAVERLHVASEQHQSDTVRSAAAALVTTVDPLADAFGHGQTSPHRAN